MATVRIQVRRGTAAQWTSANPTLAAGELGVESDTNLFKFGNGSSTWTALSYANNSDVAIGEISQDAINTALTMGAGLTKTYNDGANTITIAVDSAIVTTVTGTQTLTNKTLTSPVINSPTGITKSDVGLANVDNTSDANKPVSSATQTALDAKASNTALTNHEADSTSVHGITDTSLLATKAYADASSASAVAGIISTAPATLDTLAEISTALGADANLSVTLTNAISTKLALAGGTMTGAIDMGTTNKITHLAQPTVSSDAATKSYADTAVSDHNADTTSVHGIADTSLLATTSNVSTAITDHNADTTSVHGIADTAELATKTYANDGIANHNSTTTNVHGIADTVALATKSYADTAVSTHSDDTTNVHGIVDTAELATKTYADTAVSTHNSDTTNVHGIADTVALATKAYADAAVAVEVTNRGTAISTAIGTEVNDRNTAIGTHNSDTTSVHGIADTSALALTATVNTALDLKSNIAAPTFTGTVTIPTLAVTTTATGITKTMVGLGSVDDTADTAKPVSTAQATAIATAKSEAIADATSQVNALLTGAPAALNTLDELAAALGDDANFASTVTTSLGLKAPIASPTFTGTVTVAASGVAFTDGTQTKAGVPSLTTIATATSGAYNLSSGGLTLRDQLIPIGGTHIITVPTNTTTAYPVGTTISFYQSAGTGGSFAAADGTVTLLSTPGSTLRALYSSATLTKVATNTWLLAGDLKA